MKVAVSGERIFHTWWPLNFSSLGKGVPKARLLISWIFCRSFFEKCQKLIFDNIHLCLGLISSFPHVGDPCLVLIDCSLTLSAEFYWVSKLLFGAPQFPVISDTRFIPIRGSLNCCQGSLFRCPRAGWTLSEAFKMNFFFPIWHASLLCFIFFSW